MSDFLFRMVERAAGVATATAPQPPRTFQWMAPAMLPSPSPDASVWETQTSPSAIESLPAYSPLRQPVAKFNTATVEHAHNRHSVDVQSSQQTPVPKVSSPKDSSFPLKNASETSQPLVRPLLTVQSEPHRAVKAEATKEIASRSQNRLSENTEQIGHKVNTPQRQHRDLPVEAAHFPLEEPAQKTSIHTLQSATPLPRESKTHAADVKTPKQTSEPPVEVKIGRVEIHFDAPGTPAASPAPARPSGFSEYAELRRYVSRKR
jgi:hypothetical protein